MNDFYTINCETANGLLAIPGSIEFIIQKVFLKVDEADFGMSQ